MANLFCFGLGYSAEFFAQSLDKTLWQVAATARTASGVGRIEDLHYAGFLFDGLDADNRRRDEILKATHILISIPPDENGDPTLRRYAPTIAESNVEWIGYLSTIGVYGDHAGRWVDEDTPVTPMSERSRRRSRAERSWLEFGKETKKRVEIFRLSGIYGPGRTILEEVRSGRATTIVKDGQVFNRIHVEDISRTLLCSLSSSQKSPIWNVTDDLPASPQEVQSFAAALLGVPAPPEISFATAQLSDMARSFYLENKRVRNDKIKKELGVKLAFPTYREGLTSLAKTL